MSLLNDFLKSGADLFLTLTNEQGEKFEAGPANYVNPYNTKTVIKWTVNPSYENIFPFTYAVLHSEKKIFDIRFIRPILPNTETVLEMVY